MELRLPQGRDLQALLGPSGMLALPEHLAQTRTAAAERGERSGAGREWVERFVVQTGAREQRRQTLAARHGSARARVGRFDRYLAQRADSVIETLVDPDSLLPVQVSVAAAGKLQTQVKYEYTPYLAGRLLRSRTTFERLAPGDPGERSVMEVIVGNARFERRGGVRLPGDSSRLAWPPPCCCRCTRRSLHSSRAMSSFTESPRAGTRGSKPTVGSPMTCTCGSSATTPAPLRNSTIRRRN